MKKTDLLSAPEAAQELGVSLSAVQKRIKAGTLKAELVGSVYVVRRRDLEAAKLETPRRGRPNDPQPSDAALAKRRSREKLKNE
jgi:excisionase family DNA binding protein